MLVGLGSCEVCNRQFITQTIDKLKITSACAKFVAASAVGMSAGPFLASILDEFAGRDVEVDWQIFGGLIFNHVTGPGWVMAVLYLVLLILVIFCFKDPMPRPSNAQGVSVDESGKATNAPSAFSTSFESPTRHGHTISNQSSNYTQVRNNLSISSKSSY